MDQTDRTSQLYLEGEYLAHNPDWHAEHSPWKADKIVRILERNGVRPKRVAEVGCGAGEILIQLARQWPATAFDGYDISPQAHEIAIQREADNVRFLLGDFTEMGRDDYDLTLVIDVVEHVEDYYGFLRRLRPRSDYKVFHVPLDLSVRNLMKQDALPAGRRNVGHIQAFTKDSILATLDETGFRVVDWMYTDTACAKPKKALAARMHRFVRRTSFNANPDTVARWLSGYSMMILAQ